MTLTPGQTLLHYTIAEKIGEGGMGEVYRAADTKLARDVAIKVLPPSLAGDPDRLARFHREAQMLASLNHPHIAAIYGLEQVEGTRFLVLELVAGADLAERLEQGPIPPEQALRIARQIADALEVAHEHGIVHRDLKPANVKLTAAGEVKVLDFGLAKALEAGQGRKSDASLSPTITSAATRAGVIMGTAAYMSPEQARGDVVDKRADIWSFGCVLLELVTGHSPFRENTVSDTLAAVLRAEPDWSSLPEGLAPGVRRLLRRCLDKDPRQRLRDIGEARITIDAILAGTAEEPDASAPVELAPQAKRRGRAWITLGAILVTAVVTTAVVRWSLPSPAEPTVRRFEAVTGPFQYKPVTAPALSPDGQKVVFARDGALWVRRLDDLEPRRLNGTEGVTFPAWSPDSESIAFGADGDLKTIPVGGGSTTTVAIGVGELTTSNGVSWGPDGRIVFSCSGGAICEVAAHGGEFREILRAEGNGEADFHEPRFLPDGSLVFVVHRVPQGADTLALLKDGKRRTLLQLDSQRIATPFYSPTGHLVFRRARSKTGLWAVPFSLAALEVTGEPFLITPDGSMPSVADDGTLLYVSRAGGGLSQLVWVGLNGEIGDAVGQPQSALGAPALSPDGTRVAVMGEEGESGNIWVYDIARKTRTRLTFGNAMDWDPAWTVDGKSIVYWDGNTRALSIKSADGTGESVRLFDQDLVDSGVPSFSPDGEEMVFWAKPSPQDQDVWVLPMEGDRTPAPLLATHFVEDNPRISPDGRFLAYVSEESGKREVFLTRFPSAEGKWQVSVDGGSFPVWSPDGGALFYLDSTRVKQVDVVTSPSLQLGTPRTLFDAAEVGIDVQGFSRFEVSRDGRELLMVREVRDQAMAPGMVISYDWVAQYRDVD